MNSLLSNKAMVSVLVVVLAAAIIALTQVGENESNEPEVRAENPLYAKFDSQVDEYENTGIWDTQKYSSLKHRIEVSTSLNRQEKKQLKDVLASKHIVMLNDSITGFIKTVPYPSKDKIEYLRDDVEKLSQLYPGKTEILEARLERYDKLYSYYWGADYYTKTKKCKQSTSNYYKNGLESYYSKDYYMENTGLLNKIQKMIDNKIIMHSNIHYRFDANVLKPACNCRRDYYEFKYYYYACKMVQLITWDVKYYLTIDYDDSITNQYQDELRELRKSKYLKSDQSVQDTIKKYMQKLSIHKNKALEERENSYSF